MKTDYKHNLQTNLPKNEQEKVRVKFVYAYNVFFEQTSNVLKAYRLNDQHYNVLKILEKSYPKPISIGEVRKQLLNRRSDLTRLIDKLVHMGWIERKLNQENRRSINVTLSPCGKQNLWAIDKDMQQNRLFGQKLSEKDATALNKLLDRMRE
ncbi:MAG: MarR family transcriptional regulator [Chloroflexota bacterium]